VKFEICPSLSGFTAHAVHGHGARFKLHKTPREWRESGRGNFGQFLDSLRFLRPKVSASASRCCRYPRIVFGLVFASEALRKSAAALSKVMSRGFRPIPASPLRIFARSICASSAATEREIFLPRVN